MWHKRISIKNIILAVIILLFALYISNNYNGDTIRRSLDGIKYQSGNSRLYSVVKIEIDGILKEEEFGYTFEGNITIDGEPSSEKRFLFDEHNMSFLKTDSIRGMIYVSEGMKEISIEIYELDDRRNYTFSYDGGWVISAPCKNREEAVIITNKLKYQNGDYAW